MQYPSILVAGPLEPGLASEDLGPLIDHRPELAGRQATAGQEIMAARPDVLVLGPGGVRPDVLAHWCDRAERPRLLVQTGGESAWQNVRTATLHVENLAARPDREAGIGQDALATAERWLARQAARARWDAVRRDPEDLAGRDVVLVGAGVVNLITAVALVERGARVAMFDARPDPRSTTDWRLLGCTHGGANARMFCFTEADNYNERGSRIYTDMGTLFHRTVSDNGWLLTPYDHLSRSERAWVDHFARVPPWRARVFAEDIYAVNAASSIHWVRLREQHPHLFDGVGLVDGILRIYSEAHALEEARVLQRRLGVLRADLTAAELARSHPGLADAVGRGELAGGLVVEGFTLNIHDFCAKLIAHLEARGAAFYWDSPVARPVRADDGRISGLAVADRMVRAQHYVLSPGAYGEALLEHTRSADKIHGVLGMWMFLPNLDPRLTLSLKLHREGHVGEDSNITLATDANGRPMLIVGSGYGFTGNRPDRREQHMDSPELAVLLDALHTTCKRFFPRAYARAVEDGSLVGARQVCVRPFTTTGLGIFETMATVDGGQLVITAGHNTGGFAQAPAVAEAVFETLSGRYTDMMALFDPERGYEHAPRTDADAPLHLGSEPT